MPVWSTIPVNGQPELTLERWSIYELPDGDRHLVGWAIENREGRVDVHALGTELPHVILDDHISGQSIPGSHLEERSLLCDAWVGFTYPKLRSAQKILRDQLGKPALRTGS